MTPSSRVGRRRLSRASVSLAALISCAISQTALAAPIVSSNAVKPGVSGNSSHVWSKPQGPRLDAARVVNLGRPRSFHDDHHLGLPRRNRAFVGAGYIGSGAGHTYPQVTSIVQDPVAINNAPSVVQVQPACVSPLIISIETPHSHGLHGAGNSAEVVRGSSQSCMPDRVTVRTGPLVRSVSSRF